MWPLLPASSGRIAAARVDGLLVGASGEFLVRPDPAVHVRQIAPVAVGEPGHLDDAVGAHGLCGIPTQDRGDQGNGCADGDK
ncbi:hypothetical protein [Streptomyces graminilatus]|uniref:hypothetical protein n=1 Tax=Streptomyces graminilatus TaxID=1464070 RepID=UPI0006E1FD4F|nr:hypothetical protein [Streptomyces graminilatus]